jgi:tRNA U34 2-thiouridine synthase MnmA/TrmU
VTRIDPASNTIVIGRAGELGCDGLVADELNLIRPERFAAGATRVLAMTRYRATPVGATAVVSDDASLRLDFDEPHAAVTPGQLVALVDPDGAEMLAGATIREPT